MSNFPYADILVLALIAGFIILRLRNTLGKQIGFDPKEANESRDALRRSLNAELANRLRGQPDAAPTADPGFEAMSDSSHRTTIESIRALEPAFTVSEFLEGAKAAYEWVFNAFHQGDRATLKPLLSPEIYAEFESAIAAREAAGQTSRATLVAVNAADIAQVSLEKRSARITVRFDSEQIQVTKDAEDRVVEGDVSTVHRVEDEWIFERELGSKSPNWTVIST